MDIQLSSNLAPRRLHALHGARVQTVDDDKEFIF